MKITIVFSWVQRNVHHLSLTSSYSCLTGFIGDLPSAFSVQVFGENACLYSNHIRYPILHKIITPYFIVVYVAIPTCVMLFAYIRMGLTLYRSEFSSKDKTQAQTNLFQTCFTMMMMFSLSGLNLCIACLLFAIGYYKSLDGYYYTISILVMVLNQCVNPFVYCIRYKEFQLQLRKVLGLRSPEECPMPPRSSVY